MICEYGCNNNALHQLKNGKYCCGKNTSSCPAIKKKNSDALKMAYVNGKSREVYKTLSEDTKKRMSHKDTVRLSQDEVFINGKEWGSELLRKYIFHYKIFEYKCHGENCGISSWKNEVLTLELDHIDGVRKNNTVENLRWLCPNCHSQTPTFRGYNKTLTGKKKVSDEDLVNFLKENGNIRQALIAAGLAPKGGNYTRAYTLSQKHNL